MTREKERLAEDRERRHNWKRWGPYLSERQWGTVREDYSADGFSWGAFPHDHARRRAYRWGEDGLQGWTDRQCRLCFAPALWNGRDPILKERLYGLSGHEGNHGEDVKECYYYLDSTPTHSYTKALYKYPQAEFPYVRLRDENARRGRRKPELELADTGIFDDGRYFDVLQEGAKRSPEDLLWRITVTNRGPEPAEIHVLPSLWFRNVWKWGNEREEPRVKPRLEFDDGPVLATHETLGTFHFHADSPDAPDPGRWLFTDNETNYRSLYGAPGPVQTKDAFHRFLIDGDRRALSRKPEGTKAAAHFRFTVPPGGSITVRCRLHSLKEANGLEGLDGFEETFSARVAEAMISAAYQSTCSPSFASPIAGWIRSRQGIRPKRSWAMPTPSTSPGTATEVAPCTLRSSTTVSIMLRSTR